MQFIILVIDNQDAQGSESEMKEVSRFNQGLRDRGQLVFAGGLGFPKEVLLIDATQEVAHVQPCSLFEGPDFYSGLWVVEVDDFEAAKRLSIEASRCCNRRVEVRPFL